MASNLQPNLQPRIPSVAGEPTWEVAALLPNQGQWSEADFLEMHTNRMAELVDGYLEVLPMPSWNHQLIVRYFLNAIEKHLRESGIGGDVLFAPLPTRLFPGTIREPDVLYVSGKNLPGKGVRYPEKVDLVVEVVSEGADARKRDYEHKRIDYAKAGVSEYWIVDPEEGLITVLGLNGSEYELLGEFRGGDIATGRYFNGLAIKVDEVMVLTRQ